MATGTIQLLKPAVSVILVEDHTIPVDNIAWAGPIYVTSADVAFRVRQENTTLVYRVRFKTGGHVDLRTVTADGFASLLAGAAF